MEEPKPDARQGADPRADATRVRNQPALTTSTGLIWLVAGGLFAVTGIAILVPLVNLGSPGIALTGIVLLVALYAGMVIVRLVTAPGRLRLGLMAGAMLCIAVVALVCVGLITASEWNIVGD